MGLRYLQGRGIRHAPFGPPVLGLRAAPFFLFRGLSFVWTSATPPVLRVVGQALLVASLFSGLLMFALMVTHFASGRPRYGQWPNLLRWRGTARGARRPDRTR